MDNQTKLKYGNGLECSRIREAMRTHPPIKMISSPGHPLRGAIGIPGDKSISHRALILAALSAGETRTTGLLEADDVLATAKAVERFGATVERSAPGEWSIHGVGTGGFAEPDDVIDCGNSGTGVRLLMGAMATTEIAATFTGDSSLRSRPMGRITNPLGEFGARCEGRAGGRLPITVLGPREALPITHRPSVPSAQVKSAILLAGLNALGSTTVFEASTTRDHTERMLSAFGADIAVEPDGRGQAVTVKGYAELKPQTVAVPGDPSSAAFPVAAAILAEGSEICVRGVGVNPTRTGLFDTLKEMGAALEFENCRIEGGEPVADIAVRHSQLKGVEVPPERAPSMIDEYPILSAIAAFAEGDTIMRGVKELRVKESDRIAAMARGLEACGVNVDEDEDTFVVRGGRGVPGGATCRSFFDHRIAMSLLCLGLASDTPVAIDDGTPIATSFPTFKKLMTSLGADISTEAA